MNLAPYSKAIAAAVMAAATIATNFGVPEGTVQTILSIVWPILGVAGVYQFSNKPAA